MSCITSRTFAALSKHIATRLTYPSDSATSPAKRANPIYDLVLKIETSIKADEQQLGVGPLNRLRLGVAFSGSAKSLAELNAEAEDDGADDPRLKLISDLEGPEKPTPQNQADHAQTRPVSQRCRKPDRPGPRLNC